MDFKFVFLIICVVINVFTCRGAESEDSANRISPLLQEVRNGIESSPSSGEIETVEDEEILSELRSIIGAYSTYLSKSDMEQLQNMLSMLLEDKHRPQMKRAGITRSRVRDQKSVKASKRLLLEENKRAGISSWRRKLFNGAKPVSNVSQQK
jgi:hypothetical protein